MQRALRGQALSLQTEGVGNALIRLINAPLVSRVKEYADASAQTTHCYALYLNPRTRDHPK